MTTFRRHLAWLRTLLALVVVLAMAFPLWARPLPSWNDGPAKAGILKFVADVVAPGSPGFVPEDKRIAVFDNDGTLWGEHPLYVQFVFMLDQVKAAAPRHPEWKDNPAFKALMAHDQKALAELGQKPLLELLTVANSGMSVEAYDRTIRDRLANARHPRFKRPYTDAEREYACDRQTRVGKLDKALDGAERRGWTVVDMKRDWKRIHAFEP